MSKILMLDLEGVLIATSIPPYNHLMKRDFGIRPYAKEFVEETSKLFDNIYLVTCVEERRAMSILKENFPIFQIEFYHWNKSSKYGKTTGYDRFLGNTLIHVEDESLLNKEAKHCSSLGFDYVSVRGWYPYHAWGKDNSSFRSSDKELLVALDKIKDILGII